MDHYCNHMIKYIKWNQQKIVSTVNMKVKFVIAYEI